MPHQIRRTACALALLVAGGCSTGVECVEDLPEDCLPEYPATFEDIHARTLVPSCAVAGAACHASQGKQGGLDLSEIESAYLALTEQEGQATSGPRVLKNDAACSPMIVRLHSTQVDQVMPPGAPLREGVRCAVRNWIAQGALR